MTEEQISLFRKRIRNNDNLEEVEVANQKRKKYTKTEDKAILSYITTNQEYARVGSPRLWKEIEKENVLEGRGWKSMQLRFAKIMENVGSYDLTEEQICSLKKKSIVKDKKEEMMDVGEKEDNMSMGLDETGIEDGEEMEDDVGEVYTEDEEEMDDPEEEGESDGMSEDEEEMEGNKDLHGEEEMEGDNYSKDDDEEYSEDEDDEEDEPYKAYILVDF